MGNAICYTDDGKEHLVLSRKPYADDKGFRQALAEFGNDCVQWIARAKSKKEKQSNVAPVAPKLDDAERKILDAYERNFPQQEPPKTNSGPTLKMAGQEKIAWRVWGGWILSAFFGALFITSILLGVIK